MSLLEVLLPLVFAAAPLAEKPADNGAPPSVEVAEAIIKSHLSGPLFGALHLAIRVYRGAVQVGALAHQARLFHLRPGQCEKPDGRLCWGELVLHSDAQ